MKIALWSINFARQISAVNDWLVLLEEQLKTASQQQVQLLILPEYLSEHFLSFAPKALSAKQEIPWMAQQCVDLIEPIEQLANKFQIAILAGTIPVAVEATENSESLEHVNRSYFFRPDAAPIFQDKLCLTPSEQQPQAWCLTPGKGIQLIQWQGVKIAILICLDIEMPALSVLLAPLDIDLILVPSMTSKPAGYYRVFGCAKARAVELQTAVAVVGPIGQAGGESLNRTKFSSAAAIYQPCEESLAHNGVIEETCVSCDKAVGTLACELLINSIDIQKIRQLRHGGAEVWPGGWSASHVEVIE